MDVRVGLWHWVPKNWCFWTVVLEKTLESPLDCKEIQLVHPKDQSWVFLGRTDVEAETPIIWPPDGKNWFIWKDPDAGKDWRQEEKGWQRMRWLDGITDQWTWVWVNSRSQWWSGRPGVLQFMGSKGGTWLSDWTGLNCKCVFNFSRESQVIFLTMFTVLCTYQ